MILARIGLVAYKLQLPDSAQIHDVFHVSQLKLYKGPSSLTMGSLPKFDDAWLIANYPVKILDRKLLKRHNRSVVFVLVQWAHGTSDDATWESAEELMLRFPQFDVYPTHS
ncbi:uncharacterized protein [Rutidosis leptorrhynchoides]|uniref:uncharacterized protein n=1 Tax=Rutidosis leptorrhynchoides TaxID=125765 RepID=UPI003A9A5C43